MKKKNYESYFIVNSCEFYMFKLNLKINCLAVSLYLVDELVNQLLATTKFPH